MDKKTAWQTLRDYAEGRIDHANAGSCPDSIEGHAARDIDCHVCQALDAVQGCLAQIEEPAQPVAEICSASHDDAEFGERAIKLLRDISGFEYGTPLYAGAAPAAVAPQGVAAWMTPEGDRVVTAETMDGARKDGGASLSSLRPYTVALVRAGEPAAAAPALEAPAAPVNDRAEFEKWARQQSWIKDCQRYDDGRYGHYETEKAWATWQARAALAAAPQAPAAPSADERAAYVEFLAGKFPRTYSKEDAEHWWDNDHVSALTWQAARADAAAPAAPGIDQLLDALSQHDDPCEDIADALDRVRTLRAEADRRIRAENTRVDRMAHLSAGVLNVLRVALNRANMDYRATGFKPFEIDAAKTWVASAAPAAPAVDAQPLIARSIAEWHEDDGDVSWWAWCGHGWAGEPAWIGRPTDDGWPGYHTHWTAPPAMPPAIAAQAKEGGEA